MKVECIWSLNPVDFEETLNDRVLELMGHDYDILDIKLSTFQDCLLALIIWERNVDKQIRKIEKDVKKHKDTKALKELKILEKADKKRDKFVDAGKKALARKSKSR